MIDAEGNAASLSTSTGSGSGVIVPGTGIYLNNMLGEYDLVGGARAARSPPDEHDGAVDRARPGRPRLVVGSAGSARLRGAIMQIIVNVLEHELGVEEAIDAPRIHVDEPHVHCEGGHDHDELERLAELGYDVVRWRRNLFFGGAAAGRGASDGSRGRRSSAAAGRGGGRVRSWPHGSTARAPGSDPAARRGRPAPAPPPCRTAERSRSLRVRQAEPGDAAKLVALASAVAGEPRGGCSPTRAGAAPATSAATSARCTAIRTRPSSPRLRRSIVGRLSVMRDPHPSSSHVADLGLMVAASHAAAGSAPS